jgi:hypothetical protein
LAGFYAAINPPNDRLKRAGIGLEKAGFCLFYAKSSQTISIPSQTTRAFTVFLPAPPRSKGRPARRESLFYFVFPGVFVF